MNFGVNSLVKVNALGFIFSLILALSLAACGGGATDNPPPALKAELINPPPIGLWQPASGSTPASGNYVYLQSDAGDYIGQGKNYSYTPANATLAVTEVGGHLSVGVKGSEQWAGNFQIMNTLTQLQPGYYSGLQRYPFRNPAFGSLSWSGQGLGCNTLQGWFVVDSVTYVRGELTAIDLRFEQHCEGSSTALHGTIHWASPDLTTWQPAPGATPATGNYVYLQSDVGDYIGQGQTYSYTQATATLSATATAGHLSVGVKGNQQWTGDFQTMNTLPQLQPGYYAGLQRYPFHDPALGGLSWSGDGRGCNTLKGGFIVDSVTYVSGTLTAIDLRFEQHCEGGSTALRGAIHWTSTDTTTPAGPVNPPPVGLWQPASGATPATGNYVYLQSDVGDYIGQGQTYSYTQATATLSATATAGHLSVGVKGNQQWTGDFQTMNTLTQLQPGYYAGLQRYPFHNPALGGFGWSGDGRGCNTLKGWFIVDSVTYVGSTLTAIDLRFEQHCEGGSTALHGAIHWTSTDTTAPAGPINPPPVGLWQAALGATPATGNYVYLQSDVGDYIGQGQTYTYTPTTATLSVTANAGLLTVRVNGTKQWTGDFQTMNTLTQLQPGYYAGLQRYPFHNPVLGGLSWSGDGRGCNTLKGWFIVDSVTYVGSILTAIDLHFEQHCEGGTTSLHGAIHWGP
jgi:hypothetical protein